MKQYHPVAAAECRRCGELFTTKETAQTTIGFCRRCDEARQRLVAAQNEPGSNQLRGVVSLIVDVDIDVAATRLIAIEAWNGRFDLRLFEARPVEANGIPASLRRPWVARTDVASVHDGFGLGIQGGTVTVRFHPPLPADARTIEFEHHLSGVRATTGAIPLIGWPARVNEVAPSVVRAPPSTEEGCRGCGAPVDDADPFCARCRTTFADAVAAYSQPSPGPERVTPLNAHLGAALDGTMFMLSLEESALWFNLRYFVAPWIPTSNGRRNPRVHGRYEARDDYDNVYRGFGSSGEGQPHDGWIGNVAFTPPLPDNAAELTFAVKSGDETDLLRVTLPILRP
jgi:hypothetical protein